MSFGFVIEPSTFESDMIKVFNFETGENQDVRRNMVRALPGPRQMVLKHQREPRGDQGDCA